jgi:hypothetical protein
MAIFFHDKAITNNRESLDSQMRIVGESLVNLFTENKNDINNILINVDSGSEDDYDLSTF